MNYAEVRNFEGDVFVMLFSPTASFDRCRRFDFFYCEQFNAENSAASKRSINADLIVICMKGMLLI